MLPPAGKLIRFPEVSKLFDALFPHLEDTAIKSLFSLETMALSGTSNASMGRCRSHSFRV